jgi:hypothetical protein
MFRTSGVRQRRLTLTKYFCRMGVEDLIELDHRLYYNPGTEEFMHLISCY